MPIFRNNERAQDMPTPTKQDVLSVAENAQLLQEKRAAIINAGTEVRVGEVTARGRGWAGKMGGGGGRSSVCPRRTKTDQFDWENGEGRVGLAQKIPAKLGQRGALYCAYRCTQLYYPTNRNQWTSSRRWPRRAGWRPRTIPSSTPNARTLFTPHIPPTLALW